METDDFGGYNEVTASAVEPVEHKEGGRIPSNITTLTAQSVAVIVVLEAEDEMP